jgi:predicted Fe-S protein YdhL (DUF1289 family)
MNKEAPCIAVCMIDSKTSPCFGRGRTLPMVARWHGRDSAEQCPVMAELPRIAEAGLPTIATDPEREQGIAAPSEESNYEAPADFAVFAVLAGLNRRYCSQRSGADCACQRHCFGFLAPA